MKISILFFGIAKDITNKNSLEMTFDKKISLEELKLLLKEKYTKFNAINDFSLAVNEDYIAHDYLLKDNDIVAIIPPVSGG